MQGGQVLRRVLSWVGRGLASSLAGAMAGCLVVALAVPARAAPDDPAAPTQSEAAPTQSEVDAARAEVDAADLSLGQVQARLAGADDRLRRLNAKLLAAIEVYNTAVDKLSRANAAHTHARSRSVHARLDANEQRTAVGQWAAASYQYQTSLRELNAYLNADGPQTLLDQSGIATMTEASLAKKVADLEAAEVVARVLERQTRRAEQIERDATERAEAARRRAQEAELAQRAKVGAINAEKKALIERLADLRQTSVRLEERRQAALEGKQQERSEAERQAAAEARGGEGDRDRDADRDRDLDVDDETTTEQGRIAVGFVLDQIGEPYVFGAAGPSVWDCSGLTMRAWQRAGVSMPHFARGQYWGSQKIGVGDLRPGDLLFWATNPSDSNTIYHVAMYIGGGDMVHAPRPGRTVERKSMWYMGTPTHYARPGGTK